MTNPSATLVTQSDATETHPPSSPAMIALTIMIPQALMNALQQISLICIFNAHPPTRLAILPPSIFHSPSLNDIFDPQCTMEAYEPVTCNRVIKSRDRDRKP